MSATSPSPELAKAVAALPFIDLAAPGGPGLSGSRCRNCLATVLGQRRVCPSCGSRTEMTPAPLGLKGELRTWTIIHRSHPGVPVPFVAAIVALDGGGMIRGTLKGAGSRPEDLPSGLRVRVGFEDSGQVDADGRSQICHVFYPAEGSPG